MFFFTTVFFEMKFFTIPIAREVKILYNIIIKNTKERVMKGITVAVCLDDEGGMMFNNRRQSRDRVLIAELLSSTEGRIVIHPYSAPLFGDSPRVVISDDPLAMAADGDICFIEQLPIAPLLSLVGRFIVYRWNRIYPRDKCFDVDLGGAGFSLISETEFTGSSHERITKGIYER